MIKKLGEGTFSEVFKAQVIKTGECVAIKCMKKKYYNQGNKTKNNTFHFSLPTFH